MEIIIIFLVILNNHRRYLQKRSTLLQNNDDCLNIAIKTLIGQIGELIRFAFFFLTNRIIIKIIIKSFTIYFFHPTVAPVSMPLLRNFLNNTQHMLDTVIIIAFNYDQADRDRQCIVFCFPLRYASIYSSCSILVQTVQVPNYGIVSPPKKYYNFISFSRILLIQFRGYICKYLYVIRISII